MQFRQKPNGMWVVDFLDDSGVRKRLSTGIKGPPARNPPVDVKAVARELMLGIRASKASPTAPRQARKDDGRMTMSDLFDKCEATVWHPDNARSQATVRSNLKKLRAAIGDVALEDMTFSRLQQLVDDFKAQGYAPATIKRKMDMVSKALRMATMWSDDKGRPLIAYKPPMPQLRVDNLKDRTITPLEETAMFTAIEKRRQTEPNRQWFRFAALIRFLFDTGARLGEAIGLAPEHITSMDGTSYVTFQRYRTKSGKPRTVPLMPASVSALAGLMDHLGLDPKTGEFRFFPLTNGTAWYMFDQIREDVRRETGMDLSDVTLHTIRHTTLTRLAQGGMGLAHLQVWAGHSDPKITAERYVHLRPDNLVGGLGILASNPSAGEIRHDNGIKPGNVPDIFAAAKGAKTGTVSLQ